MCVGGSLPGLLQLGDVGRRGKDPLSSCRGPSSSSSSVFSEDEILIASITPRRRHRPSCRSPRRRGGAPQHEQSPSRKVPRGGLAFVPLVGHSSRPLVRSRDVPVGGDPVRARPDVERDEPAQHEAQAGAECNKGSIVDGDGGAGRRLVGHKDRARLLSTGHLPIPAAQQVSLRRLPRCPRRVAPHAACASDRFAPGAGLKA
ncbi:hypothetical protein THAOC_28907, partial [Thalassiosira oceanica]